MSRAKASIAIGAILLPLAIVLTYLSTPRIQAQAARRRVVLIQVDGVRANLLDQFLADGTLPPDGGFAMLSNTFKAYVQTVVTPSVTSPGLTTMVTGDYPQRHSSVANSYLTPTQAVDATPIMAHTLPLPVDGIWEPARRAGKQVGLIRTVGVTSNTLTNTWTLNFSVQATNYKLIRPSQSA